MEFWKVKITIKNSVDSDVNTEVYYSEKDTWLEAINESLNRFCKRHLNENFYNFRIITDDEDKKEICLAINYLDPHGKWNNKEVK